MVNWASPYQSANLLLAQSTKISSYSIQVQDFLRQWICSRKVSLSYALLVSE